MRLVGPGLVRLNLRRLIEGSTFLDREIRSTRDEQDKARGVGYKVHIKPIFKMACLEDMPTQLVDLDSPDNFDAQETLSQPSRSTTQKAPHKV